MRFRSMSLACVAVGLCVFGTALAGEAARTPAEEEAAKNWQPVTQDKRVRVSVERALYERPGDDRVFVHVRVTNQTARKIGLDLKYWGVIYPNQWGIHRVDHRLVIDEERRTPVARTDERKARMIRAFKSDKLKFVPPNQSVTYFREFNGSAGRREIERQSKNGKFLIMSMDGQLFYTDGQSLHDVHCEWQGDLGPEQTDIVLELPIAWRRLSKRATVVEDTVRH